MAGNARLLLIRFAILALVATGWACNSIPRDTMLDERLGIDGRVWSTGFLANFSVIRGYRVEDFLAAETGSMCAKVPNAPANGLCRFYGAGIIGWRPGYASSLPFSSIGTATTLTDRVEATPRKLQLMVQDDEESFASIDDLKQAYESTLVASEGDFQKLDVLLQYAPDTSNPHYLTQRVTIENVTRRMRWSASLVAGAAPAAVAGVIARKGDAMKIYRNQRTWGLVSQFGHGIGIFDLNAIESNDRPSKPADYRAIREQIIATSADLDSACGDLAPSPLGIADLSLSPEAVVVPTSTPQQIVAFAPEVRRGILGIGVETGLAVETAGTTAECVIRDHGFVPYDAASGTIHPRLEDIRTKFIAAGRTLNPRYTSVSGYRGELGGAPIDYVLAAAGDLGLLVLEVGPPASPYLSDPLQLAGLVWVPDGVVAVRHIPRTHMATLVDRRGRVLIVDLTRIDERFDDSGNVTSGLFATAKKALDDPSAAVGQIGVDDPRIVWKSEPGLVKNNLAPLVDPETGILITGDAMEKGMRVTAALDARIRMLINSGGGMKEVAGPTPLGFSPRVGLINASDPNASAAAFRLEVRLPSGVAKALAAVGRVPQLAVESEWVPGFDVEQTPISQPKTNLRETRRDGVADLRPTSVVLHRELPPEWEDEIWYQEGASLYTSPWIVAIGDGRGSEKWKWPAGADKAAAGCASCERPQYLKQLTEQQGVFELWTSGGISVRPDGALASNVFLGTPYDYLGQQRRLEARFTTTLGRKVRTTEVLVPANNPPVAEGMLQETHYLHSGEVETAAVDLNAGGRAGVDVVIARTYRSRTIGNTPFGDGWDAAIFRLLIPTPNGDVEYHDGAGEIWIFAFDELTGTYRSPPGLFLKLTRSERGYAMLDQQWRVAEFNERGQLASESDEFYDPQQPGSGNRIRYIYDERGRLARILDPLGRATVLKYWGDDAVTSDCIYPGTNGPCGYPGRLQEARTEWRHRSVSYQYDSYGRLTRVNLPEFKAGPGVPDTYDHTGLKRPAIQYLYETIPAPQPNEPTESQVYTDFADLSGNLKSIKDPAQVQLGLDGTPRVTFSYDLSTDPAKRDRNLAQTWATGEEATFAPHPNGYTDVLGQRRTYTLTTAGDGRAHVAAKRVHDVGVVEIPSAGLPDVISPTLTPSTRPQLETVYNYNGHGQEQTVTLPSGLVITNSWADAPGAPGTILKGTVEAAPDGTMIETDYGFDNAANATANISRVGRRDNVDGPFTYRDSATPSRSRLNVESSIDGTAAASQFGQSGQLTGTSSQGANGGVSMQSRIEYYPSGPNAVEAGRVMRVQRGNGEISFLTTYSLSTSGEETETTLDQILGTRTIITRDVDGRTTSRTLVAANGLPVSEERFGYTADGELAFHARPQSGVGIVETRVTYDVMGRQIGTETTGASVLDVPTTLKTATSYDIAGRKVISYDPHSGNAEQAPRTVSRLDRLGRLVTSERRSPSGTETIFSVSAYDIHGQLAYQTDRKRIASLTRYDFFGRSLATILTDGTRAEASYNEWDEVVESRGFERKTGTSLTLASHTSNHYTENGRLRLSAERINTDGLARGVANSWKNGDAITTRRIGPVTMADVEMPAETIVRVAQTQRDLAGRVLSESAGESKGPEALLDAEEDASKVYVQRRITNYASERLGAEESAEPRVGRKSEVRFEYDGAARPVTIIEANTYIAKTSFDEAGNVLTSQASGMAPVFSEFDARGFETRRTFPGGATTKLLYDALGNLRRFVDEMGETTEYEVDGLGRLMRTEYPDGTSEETRYENETGMVLARRDRAGQWIWFEYETEGGRLIQEHMGGTGADPSLSPSPLRRYRYDEAGRLTRISTADTAVELAELDLLGRPRVTRTIRFKKTGCIPSAMPCGTGLTTGEIAEVFTQGHEWNVFDERERWRMPVAGGDLPLEEAETPWRNWIVETRDAAGNLIAQREATSRTGAPVEMIAEAIARGAGRLNTRTRVTQGPEPAVTEFGYADVEDTLIEGSPVTPSAVAPGPPTGSLGRAETTASTTVLAGSEITRDTSRRIGSAADRALGSRISSWEYDQRGRLSETDLLETAGTVLPELKTMVEADAVAFVKEREVTPRIDDVQFAQLGADDRAVEPLSWDAALIDLGHQIRKRTFSHGSIVQGEESYAFAGGRRVSHGEWTLTYDALGRMVIAENSAIGRRIAYDYDPHDRIVGRTAMQNDASGAWTLETRTNVLARDGLPAETSFVWDPIADRLVAIYQANLPQTTPETGLLRQSVHGDSALDDPIEVLIAAAPGAFPARFLPIVDIAATGSLHATLDGEGNLVERVLYADAYGDAPRYLHGAVVERVGNSITDSDGGKTRTLTVTFSEVFDPGTLASGIRLEALGSDGTILGTWSEAPAPDGARRARWIVAESDWEAFAGRANAIRISVTTALRFPAWGDRPLQAVAPWEEALGRASSEADDRFVIVSSVSQLGADSTLYELPDLYLAGRRESLAKLGFDFHALPLRDPATGFTFVRARWYDAATASFLTPDPMGYADASSLYAYAGSDPVNFRDPTGMQIDGAEDGGDSFIANLRLSASIGLGLVPVLGDALDVVQVVTGDDIVAGEKLSAAERAITFAATAIPGVGGAAMRKALNSAGDLLKHADEGASVLTKNAAGLASTSARNANEVVSTSAHHADAVGSNVATTANRADGVARSASPRVVGTGGEEPYLISQRRAARYEARLNKIMNNPDASWMSRTNPTTANARGQFKGSRRERMAEFMGRVEMVREGQIKLGSGKYTSIHGIDAVYYDYNAFLASKSKSTLSILESKYRKGFSGGDVESLLGPGIKVGEKESARYLRQMSEGWIDVVIKRLREPGSGLRAQQMGDILLEHGYGGRRYINMLNERGQSIVRRMR